MYTFGNPAKSSDFHLYVHPLICTDFAKLKFWKVAKSRKTYESGAEGAENFSRSLYPQISTYMYTHLYVQFPALAGNSHLL